MEKLPYKIMYHHRYIDSQHKMWLPRWGYSRKQLNDAEARAIELMKTFEFE
jgi:hypothetical protein